MAVLSSPLRRCQQTAAVLAARWGVTAVIEPAVAEIPSPEGIAVVERVEWLRVAMAGNWSTLGERYLAYRDAVVARLVALTEDTVVASHFVAINAAIGAAVGDDRLVIHRLDNCSVTTLEIVGGSLHLIEAGDEADTLIR